MISCNQKENPLLSEFSTPFGVPPFEQIKPEHYMPAFEEGIRQHDAEIAAIIANPETPTFKNTIEPLEFSGMQLTQVNLIFSSLTEAETNDELQAIAKEISPKLTEHYDNISLNGELFARIKTVYENRDKENLDTEQMKVLENHYKDFVRAGALLSEEDKATVESAVKEAKEELASDDNDRIVKATEKLSSDVQGVFAKLYQQAQGAANAGAANGGANGGSDEGDTEFHQN